MDFKVGDKMKVINGARTGSFGVIIEVLEGRPYPLRVVLTYDGRKLPSELFTLKDIEKA